MPKVRTIIFRGVMVFATLVVLLLIAAFVSVWFYSSAVEERMTAIQSRGEPTSIAELATQADDEKNDATAILQGVREDVAAVSEAIVPILEENSKNESRLSGTDLAFIQARLAEHPNLIPTLVKAAIAPGYTVTIEKPSSSSAFIESQLDRTQFHRQIIRILHLRVKLLNAKGKHDDALRTCVIMFQLSRQFDHEPSLISYLVALAARNVAITATNATLRQGEISDESRQKLAAELAKHDLQEVLLEALISERALGLERFEDMAARMGYWPARLMGLAGMGDVQGYLEMFEKLLALAKQPYYEVDDKLATMGRGAGPLVSQVAPALRQAKVATTRATARLRCLRCLNAMTAPDGSGFSWDETAPPRGATLDPFTGESLHHKKTDQGPVIYSVGANRRDDGGNLEKGADVGVGPVPHGS